MSNQSNQTSQVTVASQPSMGETSQPPSAFSARPMKQLGLFFAGAGFLLASTMITRRAVVRKQMAAYPKFYQPSHRPAVKEGNPDGSLIAFEALSLATLNVISFGIMATGGFAWAFDISSVEDLRRMARRTLHGPGGMTNVEAEKEMEDWMAKVLSKLGKDSPEGTSSTATTSPAGTPSCSTQSTPAHNERNQSATQQK
jgi:hypothetical protein